MKRARFTEEQIIAVLKEHEAGAKTADLALVNETQFFDLDDARTKIAVWVADYNDDRPHSVHGKIREARTGCAERLVRAGCLVCRAVNESAVTAACRTIWQLA